MPFSAEVKNSDGTWEVVDITTLSAPKHELRGLEMRCPDSDCHAEMIVKGGDMVVSHFAHVARQASGSCAFGAGESAEHMKAKYTIMASLRRKNHYRGAIVSSERILRNGTLKRVADVFVTMPDGTIEVHEAQLAKTTIEECRQRNADYYELGVDTVIWWFGRANRNDSDLHRWAQAESWKVGTLDFTMQSVIVE